MTVVRGHWQEGRVVLDQPATWDEGSPLVICDAVEAVSSDDEIIFMTEKSQGSDPESIARWIAGFDAIPVIELLEEEYAAMRG